MAPGTKAENSIDEIIAIYQRDVDVTLLDHCLRKTVEERLAALEACSFAIGELRAGVRDALGGGALGGDALGGDALRKMP